MLCFFFTEVQQHHSEESFGQWVSRRVLSLLSLSVGPLSCTCSCSGSLKHFLAYCLSLSCKVFLTLIKYLCLGLWGHQLDLLSILYLLGVETHKHWEADLQHK